MALQYREARRDDAETSTADLKIADKVINPLKQVMPNLADYVFKDSDCFAVAQFIAYPPVGEPGAEILPGLNHLPIQAREFISKLARVDDWLCGKKPLEDRRLRGLIKLGLEEVHYDLSRTLILVEALYNLQQIFEKSCPEEQSLRAALDKSQDDAGGNPITALKSLAEDLEVTI